MPPPNHGDWDWIAPFLISVNPSPVGRSFYTAIPNPCYLHLLWGSTRQHFLLTRPPMHMSSPVLASAHLAQENPFLPLALSLWLQPLHSHTALHSNVLKDSLQTKIPQLWTPATIEDHGSIPPLPMSPLILQSTEAVGFFLTPGAYGDHLESINKSWIPQLDQLYQRKREQTILLKTAARAENYYKTCLLPLSPLKLFLLGSAVTFHCEYLVLGLIFMMLVVLDYFLYREQGQKRKNFRRKWFALSPICTSRQIGW